MCHEPNKDIFSHFWQCTAPHRLKWRTTCLHSLEKQLKYLSTKKHVRLLLLNKLKCILEGSDHTMLEVDPSVHDISLAQEKIGWHQLLKGRFTKIWNTQSTFPSQQGRHNRWTTTVISCLFDQWWNLWEIRNHDRHGRDQASQAQASATQAHQELHLMYSSYQNIAPQTLQWLFDIDAETQQQWPTAKLRQWINTWQPVLEDKISPRWAPTNPENYPYHTSLETG